MPVSTVTVIRRSAQHIDEEFCVAQGSAYEIKQMRDQAYFQLCNVKKIDKVATSNKYLILDGKVIIDLEEIWMISFNIADGE